MNKGECSLTSHLRDTQIVLDFEGSNSMYRHCLPQSAILQRSALISAAAAAFNIIVSYSRDYFQQSRMISITH